MATPNTPDRAADGRIQTEADAKSVDDKSGRSEKSSHNNKSHTKAGTGEGVGGGKKQERHH